MKNEAIWKNICDIADRVAGNPPQVVACACGQKNRVSWAQLVARDARCGRCKALIAEKHKTK